MPSAEVQSPVFLLFHISPDRTENDKVKLERGVLQETVAQLADKSG